MTHDNTGAVSSEVQADWRDENPDPAPTDVAIAHEHSKTSREKIWRKYAR